MYLHCHFICVSVFSLQAVQAVGAACSVVVKLMDLDPQGRWFDPWCDHDKICTAVGPLSVALNGPHCSRGYVSCLV